MKVQGSFAFPTAVASCSLDSNEPCRSLLDHVPVRDRAAVQVRAVAPLVATETRRRARVAAVMEIVKKAVEARVGTTIGHAAGSIMTGRVGRAETMTRHVVADLAETMTRHVGVDRAETMTRPVVADRAETMTRHVAVDHAETTIGHVAGSTTIARAAHDAMRMRRGGEADSTTIAR